MSAGTTITSTFDFFHLNTKKKQQEILSEMNQNSFFNKH
jgi:hypothetical protein